MKLKKEALRTIALIENPDLLAGVAQTKRSDQFLIGFAAETSDHLTHAREKLVRKSVDVLYVNDVSKGAVFGSNNTRGTIVTKDGKVMEVSEATKDTLANVLLDQYIFQLG